MDYSTASTIINETYGHQANMLTTNLCSDAIITLAKLFKEQNIKRQINDDTITRLSAMDPNKQCGYLANPLLQLILSKFISGNPIGCSPVLHMPIQGKTSNKPNTNEKPDQSPNPDPIPEPE